MTALVELIRNKHINLSNETYDLVTDLCKALEEIVAINDEAPAMFRKRGGTRRGLSIVVAQAALKKARGES